MHKSSAIFSKDRVYRYVLIREWDSRKPSLMFIGLNPSTADEEKDDPTIRRIMGFAKKGGYEKIYVTNIFAFGATYPKDLFSNKNPVGFDNDLWIKNISKEVEKVILAYGNLGKKFDRPNEILKLIESPYCIKISKTGYPMHPLYLEYTNKPLKFEKFK